MRVILFCLAHVTGCQNRLYEIHYEIFVRAILFRKILCPVTASCLLYKKIVINWTRSIEYVHTVAGGAKMLTL